jgi:MSHA pilin protein MshD
MVLSRTKIAAGRRSRGIAMVEVAVSILVIGLMAAAAVRTVAAARLVDYTAQQRARGRMLADGIIWEIMTKAYQDPTLPTLVLGPEAGETARSQYDDVDDYNGLTESPPQNQDGTTIPNLTNWTRSVLVEWVDPNNVTGSASLTETGCKRITVTVKFRSAIMATATAVRTNAP